MSKTESTSDFIAKYLTPFTDSKKTMESYFKNEFWTATEFSCLMARIIPDRYEKIMSETGPNNVCIKEFNKAKEANRIQEKLYQDLKERKFKDFHFIVN